MMWVWSAATIVAVGIDNVLVDERLLNEKNIFFVEKSIKFKLKLVYLQII